MSYKVDSNARYAKSHEWARVEGDLVVVGISDYAQHSLSDVVFVELPHVGAAVSAATAAAVVESVKAAEDVYSPISGEVVAINDELAANPEAVNSDPYGAWFYKLRPTSLAEMEKLMAATDYEAFVAEQEAAG